MGLVYIISTYVSIIPEIKNNLRDGYSVLILAESGSGKSNLIKRVAYDMHNEGWDVFEPVSGEDVNKAFNQLTKSDKSLLVVDVVYNRINEIEIITDQKLKNRIWQKGWTMYYPNGSEGPEYGAIKLAPKVVKGWCRNGPFEIIL